MSEASRADYAQLQREYRNMELNRKAYADESNQVKTVSDCLVVR
jgi:hypothetical protein